MKAKGRAEVRAKVRAKAEEQAYVTQPLVIYAQARRVRANVRAKVGAKERVKASAKMRAKASAKASAPLSTCGYHKEIVAESWGNSSLPARWKERIQIFNVICLRNFIGEPGRSVGSCG